MLRFNITQLIHLYLNVLLEMMPNTFLLKKILCSKLPSF